MYNDLKWGCNDNEVFFTHTKIIKDKQCITQEIDTVLCKTLT